MGAALPGYPTLLDLAIANGSDVATGLIDQATRLTPEVRLGSVRTIRGRIYKTWVRTTVPLANFRLANQGAAVVKSTYQNVDVGCYILNPRWECDKAVADGYEFGAASYISTEAEGIMEASMQGLGRQFFYGRNQYTLAAPTTIDTNGLRTNIAGTLTYGGDTLGHPGLIDGYNTAYEYDAAGTTANNGSSVWFVKWGPKFVSWVYGDQGQLMISDVQIQRVLDSASNPFTAYCQEVLAYPGLQLGDLRGVVRVKNVTADSGHTLTDAILFNAIALIPGGLMPDMCLMSRRSWNQLRNSRTATNVTGAPAPLPTDVAGIPIFVTDSLANTEPINWLGK